jgi:iron complex outermembrane receptor protein
MKILFWVLFLMIPVSIYSQQFTVRGDISDQYGMPLIGGTVSMNEQTLMSGLKGDFNFKSISSGGYRLKISYIGYHAVDTLLTINSDMNLHFHLKEDTTLLDQVVVSASGSKSVNHVEKVTNQELVSRFSGSFAKTLESVPGVNAMEIGAGASKPMIRGLGFNRIAVAENGAKQEGQQWGADHGLEIDAFSTEEVEVIKGVGTIEYGSDAIGGVIKINNEKVPQVHSFTGNATFFGKTVNDSYGASVQVKAREDNFFINLKLQHRIMLIIVYQLTKFII